MPKTTITEAPVDAVADGGHFATMPKDISHLTFYFDATPEDSEDTEFTFVKIDTPDSVSDDLDDWYQDALSAIIAQNPHLADVELDGVAIKFGSNRSGSGGEFYYSIDGDSTDVDFAPTGGLVGGREVGHFGVAYRYEDLF